MNEEFMNYLHNKQENEQTTTQETTKESPVPTTEEPVKDNTPKLKTDKNGEYHGIFLAPINHLERITKALNRMAETDEELAQAIKDGKKTFEGCDRYIRNNMKDLAREMHQQEIVFDADSVHAIARYYMVTTDNLDVQNVAQVVAKTKSTKEKTKKAEPKKEKETKKTKVIPLTPQIGNLFGDEDFQ